MKMKWWHVLLIAVVGAGGSTAIVQATNPNTLLEIERAQLEELERQTELLEQIAISLGTIEEIEHHRGDRNGG
jgi:hypothetical protein